MLSKFSLEKSILYALVTLLLLGGISCLVMAYLLFNDALVLPGSEAYAADVIEPVPGRFRFYGILFVVVAVMFWLLRKPLQTYIKGIFLSTPPLGSRIKSEISHWWNNESKFHILTLMAIIIFGVAFRVVFLDQPMRYDEALTYVSFSTEPIYIALSNYAAPNNHLFHTLLIHLIDLVYPGTLPPFMIRLPAFFAGTALIVATYVFSRTFYEKNSAIISAGFVATSSILVEYSTNARGYTLVVLIVLSLWTLAYYLRRSDNNAAWFLLSVLAAIGFHTIPIMLYPIGAIYLWLALSIYFEMEKPKQIIQFRLLILSGLTLIFLTFCLYFPVLITSGIESIVANDYVQPLPVLDFFETLPDMFEDIHRLWHRDIPDVIVFFLVAAAIISNVAHSKISKTRIPIILPIAAWIFAILLMQRVIPFTRVWLFLVPIYLVFISSGIVYLLRLLRIEQASQWVAIGLTAVLFIVGIDTRSVFHSEETGTLRSAEDIILRVQDDLDENASIVADVPSDTPITYYLRKQGFSDNFLLSCRASLGVPPATCSEEHGGKAQLFVVVREGHSFEETLEREGVSFDGGTTPELVQEYDASKLYVIIFDDLPD